MGKAVDKGNLGYLGLDFQYKLVKYFIEDQNFFSEVSTIIDQNAFTDPLLRTFVGTLKDYYHKENIVPSYEVIRIPLRQRATSEIELTEWDEFIEKLKRTSYDGYTIVKDSAIKFFKQQKIIKAANKILEIAGTGEIEQYDECENLLKDALNAGDDNDLGHSIYDLKEKALSSEYTVSIPTGIDGLDEVLGGGLDKGKVGLMMAALGVGKTTYSTAIAAYASANRSVHNNNEGWKVLQIYFEDDDIDITRKHFSRMTNVEAFNFKRLEPEMKANILEILDNHPDRDMVAKNLRLLKMRTGDTTASAIEKKILKLTNKGFKPDLVIIDYFECLSPEPGGPSNESEWNSEGRTMRRIENMAKDLNVAIWVTTQGGRDSIVSEILTADKGSGSIKKQQIVQVIVSVARNLDGQNNNSANLALIKNRSGRSGKRFDGILYDNGTSTISCSEMIMRDDTLEWKQEDEKLQEMKRTNMIRSLSGKTDEQKNVYKFVNVQS